MVQSLCSLCFLLFKIDWLFLRSSLNHPPPLLPSLPSVPTPAVPSPTFVVGVILVVLLASCGDGKSSVSGTVALDGQPVAAGAITFVKQDGELVREGAVIRDGSFQAIVPPGKYKLELYGQKVVGKRKQKGFDGKDEEVELTEELFPDRYNSKSELSEEIKPGSNTIKLDLQGSPPGAPRAAVGR